MKIIKAKVGLERGLNFQKQKYAINAELKKKYHQSKLYAQKKFSVAREFFKKQIWEQLYFICTICNWYFFSRPVWLFSMVNYEDFKIDFVTKAT